jgi:large subunit ribosomal protein L9
MVIRVSARAGAEGKLFGSITSSDVVAAVAEQAGVELDRRKVHLEDPIRTVGTHEIPVRLHADVQFRITLEVTKE